MIRYFLGACSFVAASLSFAAQAAVLRYVGIRNPDVYMATLVLVLGLFALSLVLVFSYGVIVGYTHRDRDPDPEPADRP